MLGAEIAFIFSAACAKGERAIVIKGLQLREHIQVGGKGALVILAARDPHTTP